MTFGYAVQSVLEVLGVAAVILAMIFDDKVAAWEKSVIKRIKRKLKKSRVRASVIPFETVNHDGRVG